MTKEEIKKKVLAFKWGVWIDRPFGAFFASLAKGGNSRECMVNAGVDTELPASIFQNNYWYQSEEVWDIFDKDLERHLQGGGNVFDVVRLCEEFLEIGRKRIEILENSSTGLKVKLKELYEILTQVWSHIWLAHGFEHYFAKKLRIEVPKYIDGDVEKNIGDISFPKKKNAHYYFAEALRGDMPLETVVKKFGWIKARGGFDAGFTKEELALERERLQSEAQAEQEFVSPQIPAPLIMLASISQELVYYRTLRTDVLHELMWVARPLLTKIAESFALKFNELRDCSILDLMEERVERYAYGNFSAVSYGKELALFHKPVIKAENIKAETSFKGSVAFRGIATGVAKIVRVAHEIGKVKEGDILVAPTTAPSFIMGMQRAAAFVTDEGGITSHAAIVSREIGKPCIIGTKIATKVLKDGDVVEVDAERGIVTILKQNK